MLFQIIFELQRFAIYGKSKSEMLTNYVDGNIVLAYAGNDSVYNSGNKAKIDAGTGNDTVDNRGDNVTIDGGTGNDLIWNDSFNGGANKVSINAGTGNDSIFSFAQNSNLFGGMGDDTISLESDSAKTLIQYKKDDGKDTVYGISANDTIQITGAQYEKVTTAKSKDVTLKVGTGSMIVKNGKNISFTIDGTETFTVKSVFTTGNDSYSNNFDKVTLNALAGNDYIHSDPYHNNDSYDNGKNSKIYGEGDNDTILLDSYSRNNLIQYNSGDGNDTIIGFNSDDTISIGGSLQYSTLMSGSNAVISLNGGSMTLTDTSSVNIKGGRYVALSTGETISNTTPNTLISTGADDDNISNDSADSVKIYSGNGDDSIYSSNSTGVTINAAEGNDLVSISSYSYNTVDGGKGDDSIIVGVAVENNANLNAYGTSINGGEGADYISLRGSGSTVMGGTGNDSITITGGSKWTKSTSGNNVVIKVANSGNITLVGAKGKTLNIFPAGSSYEEYTAQDVILKFMKALDDTDKTGEAAMNEAIQACSNYTDFQDLINKLCKECRSYIEKDFENGCICYPRTKQQRYKF